MDPKGKKQKAVRLFCFFSEDKRICGVRFKIEARLKSKQSKMASFGRLKVQSGLGAKEVMEGLQATLPMRSNQGDR